ncbi:transposase [Aneurinibacillus uraniidurans]|uniref:transposase n=1 Tax=Aneurinibacillus uraniidurans TaxID=2966586 RepID=UPI0023497558|nr:transposase [Aneurinibacillus sp. B1]WCN36745.1 transposase [Aneurinibacillus sp. B1]
MHFLFDVEPTAHTQSCPCCHSTLYVIHRGVAYTRKVRNLPAFGRMVSLMLPAIRMTCTSCDVSFVWSYACVAPGKRYTKTFEDSLPSYVMGAKVTHAAKQTQTPVTTTDRVFKKWMEKESPRLQAECMQEAIQCEGLVLGIDDFAMRKGHTYNTGLHDLRGNTLLDVIPGRTVSELREYYKKYPRLFVLEPVAVVMDLARYYHTFITEVYPHVIRIADCFHVNRYVMKVLQ